MQEKTYKKKKVPLTKGLGREDFLMKNIQQANAELLRLLFDWKSKNGKMIRFSIEPTQNRWVLTFFSVDYSGNDKHVFASFVGNNHDELNRWALDRLVEYKMAEKRPLILK
jgi:hypothetical protein